MYHVLFSMESQLGEFEQRYQITQCWRPTDKEFLDARRSYFEEKQQLLRSFIRACSCSKAAVLTQAESEICRYIYSLETAWQTSYTSIKQPYMVARSMNYESRCTLKFGQFELIRFTVVCFPCTLDGQKIAKRLATNIAKETKTVRSFWRTTTLLPL